MSYASFHYEILDLPFPSVSSQIYTFLCCLIFVPVVGLIVNCAIIFAIKYQQEVKVVNATEPDFTFIIVTHCLSESLFLAFQILVFLMIIINGKFPGKFFCLIQGCVFHYSCALSLLCLSVLSYERKCAIYNKNSALPIRSVLFVLNLFAVVYAILPLFALGTFQLQPGNFQCFSLASDEYTILTICLFFSLLSFISYHYFCLWSHSRDTLLNTSEIMKPRSNVVKINSNIQQKVTVSLTIAVFALAVCYIPYICVYFSTLYGFVRSSEIICFLCGCIIMVRSFNSYIYGISNPLVRFRLYKTFAFCLNFCGVTAPELDSRAIGFEGSSLGPKENEKSGSVLEIKKLRRISSLSLKTDTRLITNASDKTPLSSVEILAIPLENGVKREKSKSLEVDLISLDSDSLSFSNVLTPLHLKNLNYASTGAQNDHFEIRTSDQEEIFLTINK